MRAEEFDIRRPKDRLRSTSCLLGALLWVGCFGEKPPPEKAPPVLSSRPAVPTTAPASDASTKPKVDTPAPPAAAVDAVPDREPNDGPAEAITLSAGKEVTGFIAAPEDPKQHRGDQDWYAIEVSGSSPMTARLVLSGPDDLDMVLEHVSPERRRRGRYRAITQADMVQKRPGTEVLNAVRLAPGKHYFRVREAWYRRKARKGSLKPYTLSHSLSPFSEKTDAEPNNRRSEASQGSFDRRFEGFIGHRGDRDVWAVPLPAETSGGRVRVTLSPFGDVKMTLAVVAPGRSDFSTPVRGAEGANIELRNIYVPEALPQESRMLLLSVGARANAASVSKTYSVLVSSESALPAGATSEHEPNDAFEQASVIAPAAKMPSTHVIYGFIDHKRDEDVYKLELQQPSNLSLSLTPPLQSDLSVHLHGDDGHLSSADHTARGQSEMLRGLGLTAGNWFLVVKRQSGEVSTKAAYALQVDLRDPGSRESEPNDASSDTLPKLSTGEPSEGWIYPAGDRDFWRVTIGESEQGRIATFRVGLPPGLTVKAGLYKTDGTVLTVAERLNANATFTHFLQPGSYHVQIWGADAKQSNSQTPYTLTLLR